MYGWQERMVQMAMKQNGKLKENKWLIIQEWFVSRFILVIVMLYYVVIYNIYSTIPI